MLYKIMKRKFNNSSDLKYKKIRKIEVIYLESLCSGDKINEYIIQNVTLGKEYIDLENIVSGPNMVVIDDTSCIIKYLVNGFAIVYDKKKCIAIECKAELDRGINAPTTEASVNGPKDSFNENIQINLGLIKRRIRSEMLVNEDYTIGRTGKTKVSILYVKNIAKEKFVEKIRDKLKNIDVDAIIDIEILQTMLDNNYPFPTVLKTERPDKVCNAMLEGKIVLIADNSPFALILPTFFTDLLSPEGDNYVKRINVNFLKIIRFLALLLTIFLPAIYIAIVNYNPETIPINLLLSFQAAHAGVPFTSAVEATFMIILCALLRESDIRFPSSYGSSISILGALILGEAAVSANIVSPITIIIVGITFISGLIFNNGNLIDGFRYYRFFMLICAAIFGLYGIVIGIFIVLIHLNNITTFGEPYLYPVAPMDKVYLFKSVLKGKNEKRSAVLSNNRYKVKK